MKLSPAIIKMLFFALIQLAIVATVSLASQPESSGQQYTKIDKPNKQNGPTNYAQDDISGNTQNESQARAKEQKEKERSGTNILAAGKRTLSFMTNWASQNDNAIVALSTLAVAAFTFFLVISNLVL